MVLIRIVRLTEFSSQLAENASIQILLLATKVN